MTNAASTLVVVGWDDVLCRPTYRRFPPDTRVETSQVLTTVAAKIKIGVDLDAERASSPRGESASASQHRPFFTDGSMTRKETILSDQVFKLNPSSGSLLVGRELRKKSMRPPKKIECDHPALELTFEFHEVADVIDDEVTTQRKKIGFTIKARDDQNNDENGGEGLSIQSNNAVLSATGIIEANAPILRLQSDVSLVDASDLLTKDNVEVFTPAFPDNYILPISSIDRDTEGGVEMEGMGRLEVGVLLAESIQVPSPEITRTDAESTDISIREFSFLKNVPVERFFPMAKRRSYGQSEKPNWISKGSHLDKFDGSGMRPQLIGWDDVKCRPIYHNPVSKRCARRLTVDVVNDEMDPGNNSDNRQKLFQKKRVYASMFKKSRLFKATCLNTDVDPCVSCAVCHSSFRVVTRESEIECCGDEEIGDNANEDFSLDDTFEFEDNTGHQPRTVYILSGQNEKHRVKHPIQPTSRSSIDDARAFFRHLDSNHSLNIVAHKEIADLCPDSKLGVIRTSRNVRHSDVLRNEYREYCKAVHQTSIDPITIDEFSGLWEFYSVGGRIRDGLLDTF